MEIENLFKPLSAVDYTSPNFNTNNFGWASPGLVTNYQMTGVQPQLVVPTFLKPLNDPSLVSVNSPTAVNKLLKYQDVVYPFGLRSNILITKPEINENIDEDSIEYQKKMVKYLYYRVLDHWLPGKKYCYILNYLNIGDDKVSVVSSMEQAKKNINCKK